MKYAPDLVAILKQKDYNVEVYNQHEDVPQSTISFYLSYQKIIDEKWIDLNYRSLVIHASNLPQGKGFSPWVWQILEGNNSLVLTLLHVEKELDAGPIVSQNFITLEGGELLDEIRGLLAQKKIGLILDYLLADIEPNCHKQRGESSFYRKRLVNDSELDVTKSIESQFNLLRVVDNESYPAYFMMNGRKYILTIRKEHKHV